MCESTHNCFLYNGYHTPDNNSRVIDGNIDHDPYKYLIWTHVSGPFPVSLFILWTLSIFTTHAFFPHSTPRAYHTQIYAYGTQFIFGYCWQFFISWEGQGQVSTVRVQGVYNKLVITARKEKMTLHLCCYFFVQARHLCRQLYVHV